MIGDTRKLKKQCMEKKYFIYHKSHMDFSGAMVDPKEEDDPLLIKYSLVKAENEVSCVRTCILLCTFNHL
jgi:hypothetical protein